MSAPVIRIAPSILSADFACLGEDIATIEPVSDLLHVDVMDGHFVPNLTIGPPVVKSIRKHTLLPLDCHLMMTNPGDYLERFREAGADGCSVHVEVGDTEKLIDQMRDLGLGIGLAVNPDTPFERYQEFLGELDLVLVMTVFPGFGGQAFMDEVVPKIRETADAIADRALDCALEVDGGIDADTVKRVCAAGADTIVAGSAIFARPDPAAAAAAIRTAAVAASDR